METKIRSQSVFLPWCVTNVEMRASKARTASGFLRISIRVVGGVPRIKRFLSNAKIGTTPQTLWTAAEVGTNDFAKKHLLQILPNHQLFDTPKPEPLIQRILEIATNPGELVVDAYLGSGTTAAVAHKMNRKYIGIEIGNHAATHCVQRLKKVIDGNDTSLAGKQEWVGGGGFDFYKLIK